MQEEEEEGDYRRYESMESLMFSTIRGLLITVSSGRALPPRGDITHRRHLPILSHLS
jgi:hypothetical protein